MILDIIEFVRTNKLRLPTDIAYLGKAAINLEGTVRELDPSFNPTQRLKKFITTSTKEYIVEKLGEVRDSAELAFYAIFKLENAYRLLIRERISIQVIFKDLEELQQFYKNQIHKIVYAIMFIGLLLSIPFFKQTGYTWEVDILFVMAVFFGAVLFYKIFKH